MSKPSRIRFSIFGLAPLLACLPFRCHSQTGWRRLPLPLYGKESFQVLRLEHPLKRRVFCLKSALRPERRGEQGQDEAEQRDHSAPTRLINMEQVFGTHNHLLTLLIVIMGGPQRMIATRRCSPRTSSEAANEITK
jgi:hypothetical protein